MQNQHIQILPQTAQELQLAGWQVQQGKYNHLIWQLCQCTLAGLWIVQNPPEIGINTLHLHKVGMKIVLP